MAVLVDCGEGDEYETKEMGDSMKQDYPSQADFETAAKLLGCEVAAIRAVAEVEAGSNGAFLETGEPVILFEPHIFHKLTSGEFDSKKVPGIAEKWASISYPSWRMGWYGSVSVQHRRLTYAATLDRDAALKSASWGLFQIMGHNYTQCGYDSLQSFVNAMYRDVEGHLEAFCGFIENDERSLKALRDKDWKTFKRVYNGPGKNNYAERMSKAYKRLTK